MQFISQSPLNWKQRGRLAHHYLKGLFQNILWIRTAEQDLFSQWENVPWEGAETPASNVLMGDLISISCVRTSLNVWFSCLLWAGSLIKFIELLSFGTRQINKPTLFRLNSFSNGEKRKKKRNNPAIKNEIGKVLMPYVGVSCMQNWTIFSWFSWTKLYWQEYAELDPVVTWGEPAG